MTSPSESFGHPLLADTAGARPVRPLRIAIASFDFVGPVRNGGVGTAFTSLGEALAAAGHEVTLLFLAGQWCENRTMEYWIEYYKAKGIQFVPLPDSGLRIESRWHVAKGYEGYLWLRQQNYDVIHFSEWKGPGYFSLLAKQQGLAFPHTLLCVHTHGPTLWHKLSNAEYVSHLDDVEVDYIERRSVQMADVVVSPSQYLLRWMLERDWVLPEQCFVRQYVRPATARQPLADADRVQRISELVFFGRLEVRKGLVLFCDALDLLKSDPKLRQAKVTFLGKVDKICGRDSAEYVAERARQWPWKWQMVSDRDQAGAMDYLQGRERLAVLPSLVDNLPNTVLECLGAKVPFLASDAGGIPEMIAVADLGATCFPVRAKAFADKLRQALLAGVRPAKSAVDAQENERAWVRWHESRPLADPSLLSAAAVTLPVNQPLVSICMSHWNRPAYLRQAMASIEAQDYPNFEVVLVDDGSTSAEALRLMDELAAQFGKRGWQLLRNEENRYPGAARNLAARHARGEFILFMDDDNCAKPHAVSTFVRIAQRTGADILTCCLDTFSGKEAPHAQLQPRTRWLFLGDDTATGALRNNFGDTNSLWRREVFLALGGFHEDWGVGHEDWELFAKAVLQGYQLQVVPDPLAWYRLNDTEETVNRKTPRHANHLANLRPYLEAVSPPLRHLIRLVQGQFESSIEAGQRIRYLEDQANRNSAKTPYAQATIEWRSGLAASRHLLARQLPDAARELLVEAVNAAERSKDSQVILEALLEIVPALGQVDPGRARYLGELAVKLAGSLRNPAELQLARQILAAVPVSRASGTAPTAPPSQPGAVNVHSLPRLAAIGSQPGVPKFTAGFLSFEPHDYACPTLRLKSVLEHLHASHSLELVPLGAVRDGKFQLQEANLKRAEIIVVQRQMAGVLPLAELRQRLKGRPARIVFEMDDALTRLPEWHRAAAAFRQIQPQIEEYLRGADLVTVSTPQLQSLYGSFNRNLAVLPNSVDTRLWPAPSASREPSDKVTILFSGALDHERDLQIVEPALLDLLAAFPEQVEFLYWGNITERLRELRQVKSVGAFRPNYQDYAAQLQRLPVSLALVPLEDTGFNRAKSAVKWLEYSICRIPGIYSDVPAYNQAIVQGQTGLLVPNTRDGWFNAMKTLVEDRALRHELAARAQAAVLARHTVELNARLWLGAYESLFAPPMSSASAVAAAAPAVTIVIPAFNQCELTRQCLLAVQKNTPEGQFEVVVVDNSSTDGTADLLKAEAGAGRLRAVVNSENLGFAQACNQGAQAARSEYILFLNNDTEVQPGWLDALVSLADADPTVAAVGSKLLFPNGTLQHAGVAIGEVPGRDPFLPVHTFYKAEADLAEANQRRIYQALTAACLLVRKSAFEAVGGFDEGFWNGYEDVDLCLRLQEQGWLMVYEPASVVIHHESQSGPARFAKVKENIRRLHQKWLGKTKLDVSVAADGAVTPAGTTRIRPYTLGSVEAANTSIVILSYNQLAHTKACLESIARHTSEPYELILVDNGSTDGTSDYLREYAAQHERVLVVANRTNRGFAAGNNQGLALATGRQVLCLNNDTVVSPGWLGSMLRVLQEHPQTGVVGPRSNRVLGQQQVDEVGYQSLAELPAFAAAWAETNAGKSQVANRVVGFCLLARREVIKAVGGLDEQFGSGNFEDDDFCIRAHLAGFATRIADDSFVHHVGHATFTGAGIDYTKAMQTNWTLFKSKWAIPAEMPSSLGYFTPDVAPPGVALKVPLPELPLTHQLSVDGRCWMEKVMAAAAKAKPITLPPCALVGQLREAQQFLQQKKLPAAWGATRAALKHRPFHPEAYLLLAEIALAAQDSVAALACAQFARQIAPEFRPAKKFLKGKLHGHLKPEWLVMPEEIGKHKSESRNWLSVCLIVKNEERFLGQCLASIKGLAHQVVVVDTGSTDRTVAVAKEHGAQVHSFAWCDDFSAARNAALEHATGDWVLILDADEELPPEQHAALRKLLHNISVISWRLPLQDVGREAEGCSYVPRLFRNAPGLYYAGRVHEQVFTRIEERRAEWGLETRLGDATLRHYGYTKELTLERDKVGRNLRLLEQAIIEAPGDTNLLMNYGLELTRSGRREEGLRQYRAAFEAMADRSSAQVAPEMREALLTQFGTHLLAAKRHAEIVQVLTSQLAKQSGGLTASLHFTLGLAQTELKEFSAAAEQFRQCLAKRDRPALTPISVEIRKAGPRHCLALCLEQMGETGAADEEFRRAMEAEPQALPLRRDYARFLAAHERQADALNLLFALASEKPTEAQVWLQGGQLALSRPEFLELAVDWTAEAAEHLPDDPAVVRQRAEALMLAGQCDAALPLWRRWPPASDHALAAALMLCETAAGENQFSPKAADEAAISREFVKWYRKLLRFNARPTVESLNAKMAVLERMLPSAAAMLASAVAEATEAVRV